MIDVNLRRARNARYRKKHLERIRADDRERQRQKYAASRGTHYKPRNKPYAH